MPILSRHAARRPHAVACVMHETGKLLERLPRDQYVGR